VPTAPYKRACPCGRGLRGPGPRCYACREGRTKGNGKCGLLPCVACGAMRKGCGKGLCLACFGDPAVRARFPGLYAAAAPSATPDFDGTPPPPAAPTDAPPGSAAKVEALAARAAAGEALWCRGDARDDDRARGWPAGRVVHDAGPRRRTG
jgi:hypothetical protein